MSLFVVDRRKCRRDGLCVAACPRLLIEIREDAALPTAIAGAEERCQNCGHCVAVCPTAALAHRAMVPERCEPVRPDELPSALQVEHLLRARRSIRTFRGEAIPREELARLLDVARYAPTGSNRQQVRWLVIYESPAVQQVAHLTQDWLRHTIETQPNSALAGYRVSLERAAETGSDAICRDAPHLVFAYGPSGRETDGVIALTYLELAAYPSGIGVCWAGFVTSAARDWKPLREHLGLAQTDACYGALMLGYPRYGYARVPLRNEAQVAWR